MCSKKQRRFEPRLCPEGLAWFLSAGTISPGTVLVKTMTKKLSAQQLC